MGIRNFTQNFDWLLLSAMMLILSMGMLALYSFSETVTGNVYFGKQLLFALLGIGSMLFMASLDYRHIARLSTVLYFVTLLSLILVLLIGQPVRGTVGWISLFGFQIQPVEFAKLTLIIFLASFISKKRTELGEWTRLIASLFLVAIMIVLVLKQPDLGSSLVLLFIWGSMILVSGIRLKHFIVLALLGGVLLGVGWTVLAQYQKDRIETFIHPELDPKGAGYNVLQAMVAVGSGGFTGKGIGHGSQSQLNFLPEKHTDFIFAVLAEELGLLGAGVILFLYGLMLYRIERIALRAQDNAGYLIAVGIFSLFFIQIVINVGMNMGLLPVTGLPAPFLSYGGSSLLTSCIAIGLLLSIFRLRGERGGLTLPLEQPGLSF